jgi:hypothetical protein
MKPRNIAIVVVLFFTPFLLAGSLLPNGTAATGNTPTITYLSPASKMIGDNGFTMTIAGTNFWAHYVQGVPYAWCKVYWNGVVIPSTWNSETRLTADISASRLTSAGTAKVKVVNAAPDGSTPQYPSNEVTFTINNRVPTTTDLIPDRKFAGESGFNLTVGGTNFVAGSKVRWNGNERTTTYVNQAQLAAAIPASDIAIAGTANVSVWNPTPGGGTSSAMTLTINNPEPTITSLSPQNKAAGDPAFTLTVNGTNFVAGSKVRWNDSNCTTTYVNSTKLMAAIPASDIAKVGTASVTVFNPTPGGGVSPGRSFRVTDSPSPTPPTPTAGSTWCLVQLQLVLPSLSWYDTPDKGGVPCQRFSFGSLPRKNGNS